METGCMTFLFGLAAPKAVLMILTGKVPAGLENPALQAHQPGLRLAMNAGSWALCCRWEENRRQSTTSTLVHPRVDAEFTPRKRLVDHHPTPSPNLGCC
jgi:hypothetical protein